ncbi:Calcium-binding EF-hand [Cynara cardunculus var. scolymus]|uniref:Calcium-binding EF-hand n=2 Tax=Cynara cardunculus var. scolymus TaxID=59895 RepID=A0A103YB01_CYNCS|nr:Calcium-binding EF-hand [Cynara cardunculus var. scolymus]
MLAINSVEKPLEDYIPNSISFRLKFNSKVSGKHAYNPYLYNSYFHSPIRSIIIIIYPFNLLLIFKIMNKSSDCKRIFDRFDEDGDGMISPLELQRGVGLIWEEEVRIEEVEAVVESLQVNNGQLAFEDFVSLMESQKEEEKLEDLRRAFRMYEMDGTDCITPKSLNRMLNRLGESTSVDQCVGMINQFDINGDGVLNFDEFRIMML